MSARLSSLVLIWCLASTGTAGAVQESQKEDPVRLREDVPPLLQPVFSDDFSTDTRGDYEVEGDVSWRSGMLTLAEGAAICREIQGGAWARVELRLDAERTNSANPIELRVRFLLEGATDCLVLLRNGGDGQTSHVTLVDTQQKDGKAIEQIVRQADFQHDRIDQLCVEYRHGLVAVTTADQMLLLAFIDNDQAAVRATYLEAVDSPCHLREYSAMKQRVPTFTNSEKQQLEHAKDATADSLRLFEQGKFAEAQKIGEQVLEIHRVVLGNQHPDYADSLRILAHVSEMMGEPTRAERLFRQTLKLQKVIYGEEHPYTAIGLTELGLFYDSARRFPEAAEMHEQAMEIRKAALGEWHPDYATSLNNLAAVCENQLDYARAKALYERANAIDKQVLGAHHTDYAISLSNLAGLHLTLGQCAIAKPLLQEATTVFRENLEEEHFLVATSRDRLGLAHAGLGEYEEAEALFRKTLNSRRSALGKNHPDCAQSLDHLAGLYFRWGKPGLAEPLFRDALTIRREAYGERHYLYAESLSNLGVVLQETDDLETAESMHQQALDLRRAILGNEHPACATSLSNLATLYLRLGDGARARPLFEEALEITKSVFGEAHPTYAMSLNNLGGLYDSMGSYQQSEETYRQALRIQEAVRGKEHPEYAVILNNLAGVYEALEDFEQAKELYEKALRIRKQVLKGEHPDYGASLNNLAHLLTMMADYDRARPLYEEACEVFRKSRGTEHAEYATSLNNFALLLESIKDYDQAVSLHQQALKIRKSARGDRHPEYANSLNNLGALYSNMGRYAMAEPYFRESLEIRRETLGETHPDYAGSLSNLAVVIARTKDTTRALQFYEQAGGIWKEHFGDAHSMSALNLNNRALMHILQGDSRHALQLYGEALRIQRELLARHSLAQSERQQNRHMADTRFHLDDFLSHALRLNSPADGPLEELWQWKGAVTLRQLAYRKVASETELQPLFEKLQSVSRQLSALSAQAPVPPQRNASELEIATYGNVRKSWRNRFTNLSQQREELEQQIAAASEEFRRFREPLTVDQVQAWLPEHTALVEFVEYTHLTADRKLERKTSKERRYIAFVVRSDREPGMIGLGSAVDLAASVTSFRRPFDRNQNNADTRQAGALAGRKLRKSLWLQLEGHLDGIDTVIISPDAALGTLPFAALPGKAPGTCLLEDYRIAMMPMAALLPALFKDGNPRQNDGLLLVGDVAYDAQIETSPDEGPEPSLLADAGGLRNGHNSWTSLSGFREELESVRTLYRERHGRDAPSIRLTGSGATKLAFLKEAPKYSTLHVITHGYFEDADVKSIRLADVRRDAFRADQRGPDPFINTYLPGLLSGLVMAGANNPSRELDDPRDGILRASEIEATSLPGVDLVVLSACDTGLGAVAGGEGLTGLQRAFHIAGAHSVIASLWKVDDRATQELMTRFYTNLWEHDMSKIDALREAQLWMLRHPKKLEAMGVKGATTRGDVRPLKPTDPNPREAAGGRTDPFFWAAFQLSGDWR